MKLFKTGTSLIVVLMLSTFGVVARAQSGGEPGTEQQPATSEASSDDQASEEAKSAEPPTVDPFGDEVLGHLQLNGVINYRYEYDDNVFSGSAAKVSDNISTIGGRFSLTVRKKRSGFQLHYAPNYRIYSDFDQRNTFSQSLANSIDHAFSGRTTLNWTATLTDRASGSNSGVSFENVGGVLVPVFHPDGLQSGARVLSSHAGLTLSHRFTARSTLDVGVSGGTSNFFAEDNGTLLSGRSREQFSVGANAGWNYQFKRGRFIGVSASQQYLAYLSPGSHINFQTVQLTYAQQFRKGFSIHAGAGPSFTQNSQPAFRIDSTSYSISAGAQYARVGSVFALAYNRGVSLGSLQSSIVRDGVSGSYSRALARRLHGSMSVSYARSQTAFGIVRDLESVGIGTTVNYSLTRAIGVTAQFNHTNQFGNSGSVFNSDYDRNTFSVGLSYRFGSERGR